MTLISMALGANPPLGFSDSDTSCEDTILGVIVAEVINTPKSVDIRVITTTTPRAVYQTDTRCDGDNNFNSAEGSFNLRYTVVPPKLSPTTSPSASPSASPTSSSPSVSPTSSS